jgi:hypothetical protein
LNWVGEWFGGWWVLYFWLGFFEVFTKVTKVIVSYCLISFFKFVKVVTEVVIFVITVVVRV